MAVVVGVSSSFDCTPGSLAASRVPALASSPDHRQALEALTQAPLLSCPPATGPGSLFSPGGFALLIYTMAEVARGPICTGLALNYTMLLRAFGSKPIPKTLVAVWRGEEGQEAMIGDPNNAAWVSLIATTCQSPVAPVSLCHQHRTPGHGLFTECLLCAHSCPRGHGG